MTAPVVRTAPVVDELVGEEGGVLLVGDDASGHRVLRITILGQAIREHAMAGVLLPVLVDELIEIFGPPSEDPDEATRLVEVAVETLAAEEVLTID